MGLLTSVPDAETAAPTTEGQPSNPGAFHNTPDFTAEYDTAEAVAIRLLRI